MRALVTVNRHAVTAHEGRVVMLAHRGRPWAFEADPAEALELAAWLIVGAELADPSLASDESVCDGTLAVAELVARIKAT